MVRPLGRPLARRTDTLKDLREEFLQHCEARNLSGRTLEWYADTRRFADWCSDRGISAPSDLRWSDLEAFVLDRVGCIYSDCVADQGVFALADFSLEDIIAVESGCQRSASWTESEPET